MHCTESTEIQCFPENLQNSKNDHCTAALQVPIIFFLFKNLSCEHIIRDMFLFALRQRHQRETIISVRLVYPF